VFQLNKLSITKLFIEIWDILWQDMGMNIYGEQLLHFK